MRIPVSTIEREKMQGEYPYYGAQGIIDHVNDYIFDGEYVLIAEDGANLVTRNQPIAQIVRGRFWVNNHAHIVRGKEGVATNYFVNTLLNSMNLTGYVTGAAQPKLSQKSLRVVEVDLPSLAEQKQICNLLSTYDDLIENNRRRIQLLEQAARLLYKEWFVHLRFPGHEHVKIKDGVPEGWEKKQVKDLLAKVKRPGKIQKADYLTDGPIPCVDQSREFIGGYTDQIETMIDELPMIVFGDHTRILNFIDFPFACGADGTQLLATHDPKISQEFFFFSLDAIDLSNYFYARHFKFLKDQHIPRPTDVLIHQFTGVARPILKQVKLLREQNGELAKARDLLLPKLMNGEVAV